MIKDNIQKIINDIEEIKKTSFSSSGVTIIAASKMQDELAIEKALEAGIKDLGENKVQEFKEKYDIFKDRANFHQIGSLQSNKAKDVLGKVKLIHSLDRMSLLKTIEKRAIRDDLYQDCLLQVNVAKEDTKSGFYLEEVDEFLDQIETCERVKLKGLMTMAPYYDNHEDARWVFDKLKEKFDEIKDKSYDNISMEYLSMGMSHDYKEALKSGSNMIRIGTAIFGKRNY